MSRNPNFRGKKPKFDEIQFIKYGTIDAVERALRLGEIDIVPEAQAASFGQLGEAEEHQDRSRRRRRRSPQLTFNLCSKQDCPDAKFNPAVQDRVVRQAIAYGIDREQGQRDRHARHVVRRATACCPTYYKSFYQKPAQDYPLRPRQGEPDARRRRLQARRRRRPAEGRT